MAIIAGALCGVLSLSVLLLVGILVRRKHRNRNSPLCNAETAGDEASLVPPGRAQLGGCKEQHLAQNVFDCLFPAASTSMLSSPTHTIDHGNC